MPSGLLELAEKTLLAHLRQGQGRKVPEAMRWQGGRKVWPTLQQGDGGPLLEELCKESSFDVRGCEAIASRAVVLASLRPGETVGLRDGMRAATERFVHAGLRADAGASVHQHVRAGVAKQVPDAVPRRDGGAVCDGLSE